MQKWIYRWLIGVGVSHIILGMVFILIADSPLISFYIHNLYDAFSLHREHNSSEIILRFILQLFGPTVASWGVLFTLGIVQYHQSGNQFARVMLIFSLLIWFIFDSILSAIHGVNLHLYINVSALLALLLPLLLFKPKENKK